MLILIGRVSVSAEESCNALPEPSALVDAELERITLNGWTVESDELWTHVRPAVSTGRVQGWKLHVSATIVSAPEVLRACLPLLVESGTPFKFASTTRILENLNALRTPRGNSGKFITVYPADDTEFRDLARRLHEATEGMAGPVILSDAPYRKGSLVHYRYGAFAGLRILSNDGMYRDCVLSPEGYPVEDRRAAVFSPPAWAVAPLEAPAGAAAASAAAVLLNGRFEVSAAIRHANKGGVYRASDRLTGAEVIIKEARPDVATDRSGEDARDLLRHEAKVLRHLASLGLVPQVVDEFDQDGHHFLAEQLLPGETLQRRLGLPAAGGTVWPPAEALPGLIQRLTRVVHNVHAADVVIRDLAIRRGDAGGPAVLGQSYGAFLALLAACAVPEHVHACVAVAPFRSAARLYAGGAGAVRRLIDRLDGLREITDPFGPRDVSRLADRITARTLLIHGARDEVVPVEESRALHARFVALGRRPGADVTYLEVAGDGHDPCSGPAAETVLTAIRGFLTG
jgi:pimeloyl-ACP methyl ester carboxylesterase